VTVARPVTELGAATLGAVRGVGGGAALLVQALAALTRPPFFSLRLFLDQCQRVGVQSIPVVLITGTFTGMVLAYESAIAFRRFGAEELIGTVVALSMTRELGPVLTGIMVAGRVGSAMAAELGTMRITSQIDALVTLATNPVRYLVVPRLLAATVMLPCLVLFANLLGIVGGWLVAVIALENNPVLYERNAVQYLRVNDLVVGLWKATLFGATLALVGCYMGYTVRGGAREVGIAVTRSVVASLILILVFDYLLTAWFFG
jgi:phospholipid/cholesterol/gamma-HCH transport system permease protein